MGLSLTLFVFGVVLAVAWVVAVVLGVWKAVEHRQRAKLDDVPELGLHESAEWYYEEPPLGYVEDDRNGAA